MPIRRTTDCLQIVTNLVHDTLLIDVQLDYQYYKNAAHMICGRGAKEPRILAAANFPS